MKILSRSNYAARLGKVSLCILPLLGTSQGTSQTSMKPAICDSPTQAPPKPIVPTVVALNSVPVTALNTKLYGTWGDGQHEDGAVIQSLIQANPYGTIFLPLGIYRLENPSLNKAGLMFQNFHGRFVLANGARLLCTNATTTAGQCIHIYNSSNATFDNLEVGYFNNDKLPMGRNSATNNAILVERSTSITLNHTTVEASTGSGIWVTDSKKVTFNGGTWVSNTTADGLHFENDADSSVTGFTAGNTGDDSLAATNIQKNNPNCGLTASHLRINNSRSRGIAVAGACTATFDDFAIDMTANSGIGSEQDTYLGSRVPTDIHFTNGTITRAGQYTSIINGNKDCVDFTNTTNSSVSGVSCGWSKNDGVFVFQQSDHITIDNVAVHDAGNVGFQAVNATNVVFSNDVTRSSAREGYAIQQVTNGQISGSTVCSAGNYGFYHSGSRGLVESNLQSYDSSEGQSSNRVWWAENMNGSLSLRGLTVFDDKAQKKPIVVGAWNAPGVSLLTVLPQMLSATLSVSQ